MLDTTVTEIDDRARLLELMAKGVHSAIPIGNWGDDLEHMKDCIYEARHVLAAIERDYVIVDKQTWDVGREAWRFLGDALRPSANARYLSGASYVIDRSRDELDALLGPRPKDDK